MKLYAPTTFTDSFAESIKILNDNMSSEDAIEEVYGSLPSSPFGSARPKVNLPKIGINELRHHLDILKKIGVRFSYLFNAPSSRDLDPNTNKEVGAYIDTIAELLQEYNASAVVASYEMLQYLKKKFHLRIIVSLVLDIKEHSDIEFFVRAGADKIVLSTTRNRDFAFLKNCESFKDRLILMANESCLFNCKDRQSHFRFASNDSSTLRNKRDFNEIRDHYMLSCTIKKLSNPENLIKSSWIRPEDLHFYEAIGLERIKLADRTKPEEWLIDCYRSYLNRKSPDNFFELIAITPNNISGEETNPFPKIYLDNKKLNKFIEFFYKNNIDCLSSDCSQCKYCSDYAEKVVYINKDEKSHFLKRLDERELITS